MCSHGRSFARSLPIINRRQLDKFLLFDSLQSVLEKNDELMDLTLLSNGLICMSIFDTGQNLLQDIFTALYPPSTQMMPGWQRAPHFGMGYAMQYPPGVVSMSF
jgi:hypothetical protein